MNPLKFKLTQLLVGLCLIAGPGAAQSTTAMSTERARIEVLEYKTPDAVSRALIACNYAASVGDIDTLIIALGNPNVNVRLKVLSLARDFPDADQLRFSREILSDEHWIIVSIGSSATVDEMFRRECQAFVGRVIGKDLSESIFWSSKDREKVRRELEAVTLRAGKPIPAHPGPAGAVAKADAPPVAAALRKTHNESASEHQFWTYSRWLLVVSFTIALAILVFWIRARKQRKS